jgi:sugar lactone lactonase YvrE
MKNKKFFIIAIFIFLFLGIGVFARHVCTDPPLEQFADGSTSKIVNVTGTSPGPTIKLPTDTKVCFAKIKIDFAGSAEALTPYLWVPVSGANQLVQIKISDGSIIHTFMNGADNCVADAFNDPSRITTIPGGDIWVANRKGGSVTRLGRKANCTGDDCYECKGTHYGIGDSPRGITYDSAGNIWVGAYSNERMCIYRPDGSLITCNDNSKCQTYGMIGDRSGNVWVSDRANGRLCRCSGAANCVIVKTDSPESYFPGAYGIGIDNDDHIWIVRDSWSGEFCEYIPAVGLRCQMFTGGAGHAARGIAVDGNNYVWVASSGDNTGACAAEDVAGPIGLAVDSNNNIWAVSYVNPGKVYKIDQNCKVLQTIVIGACPYNYSDMTGFRTPKVATQIGTGVTYSFSPTFYPYTICSVAKPEIGCDPADPHVLIDSNFDDALTKILAGCAGGNQTQETWCGNPMCEVPTYLSAIFATGQYTLSDLRIEWQDPPSKFTGGFVPCGRLCDDLTTDIFEDCPCRLCHFFILGHRIVNFALFKIIVPLAVLMIVIGGAMFLTAGGSPEKISGGKRLMKNAIFGILIIFATWLIVNTILMLVGVTRFTRYFDDPATAGIEAWWQIICPVPGLSCIDPVTKNTVTPCFKSAAEYCKLPPSLEP